MLYRECELAVFFCYGRTGRARSSIRLPYKPCKANLARGHPEPESGALGHGEPPDNGIRDLAAEGSAPKIDLTATFNSWSTKSILRPTARGTVSPEWVTVAEKWGNSVIPVITSAGERSNRVPQGERRCDAAACWHSS